MNRKTDSAVKPTKTAREELQVQIDAVQRRINAIPDVLVSEKARLRELVGVDDAEAERTQIRLRTLGLELARRKIELEKLEERWPEIIKTEHAEELPGLLKRRAKLFAEHAPRAQQAPANVDRAIREANEVRKLERRIRDLDLDIIDCANAAQADRPRLPGVNAMVIDLNRTEWVPVIRFLASGEPYHRTAPERSEGWDTRGAAIESFGKGWEKWIFERVLKWNMPGRP